MKKRNYGKLALDIAMLIILLLSYNHSSVNQAFHEIAGFALMGGVVLHLILNRQWIAGVAKKFFTGKLPVRTRVGCVVDFLMLCCFLAVGVSGAMISKVVFSLNGGMVWKTVHYFASAVLLVLLGIHLGLHLSFFANMLGSRLRLPAAAKKAVCAVLIAVLCGWGCRSMATTGFVRWLTMPFSASQSEAGDGEGGRDGFAPGTDSRTPTDSQTPTDGQTPADGAAAPDSAQSGTLPEGGHTGKGDFSGGGMGGRGGEGEGGGFSALRALSTLADFFSIAFVFAALTRLAEWLLNRRRKPKTPVPAQM